VGVRAPSHPSPTMYCTLCLPKSTLKTVGDRRSKEKKARTRTCAAYGPSPRRPAASSTPRPRRRPRSRRSPPGALPSSTCRGRATSAPHSTAGPRHQFPLRSAWSTSPTTATHSLTHRRSTPATSPPHHSRTPLSGSLGGDGPCRQRRRGEWGWGDARGAARAAASSLGPPATKGRSALASVLTATTSMMATTTALAGATARPSGLGGRVRAKHRLTLHRRVTP
jgi:hypothetical protein